MSAKAIAAAQAIMRLSVPSLIPDGKWGRYTQGVYDQVNPSDKNMVDAVLATHGLSAEKLKSEVKSASEPRRDGASGSILAALRAAALEFDVPYDYLLAMASIESGFNPTATNGSSRGLMQFQPAAWDAVSARWTFKPYKAGVFDFVENARAGAAYTVLNRETLKKVGYRGPLDSAHMYLAHQQGAGGLKAMYDAAQSGSSGPVSPKFAEAMRRNPPQDGKGVTTNPVDFYNRWVSVVRAKLEKTKVTM